jgi:hypothetical protein
MALTQSSWVLSDDLLERCAQRAAGHDRENRFFFEDFDELREAKYLLAAIVTARRRVSECRLWAASVMRRLSLSPITARSRPKYPEKS